MCLQLGFHFLHALAIWLDQGSGIDCLFAPRLDNTYPLLVPRIETVGKNPTKITGTNNHLGMFQLYSNYFVILLILKGLLTYFVMINPS